MSARRFHNKQARTSSPLDELAKTGRRIGKLLFPSGHENIESLFAYVDSYYKFHGWSLHHSTLSMRDDPAHRFGLDRPLGLPRYCSRLENHPVPPTLHHGMFSLGMQNGFTRLD